MSLVAISVAARLVGRDRKTLYRAIAAGRLSATVGDSGEKQVDTSELMRVYGPLSIAGDKGATVARLLTTTPHATVSDIAELAALRAENVQLRERLVEKDKHMEDLRLSMRLLEDKSQLMAKLKRKKK